MNFNVDGFNERNNYIHNSNDRNNIMKNGPSKFDNSFAKMRVDEHRNDVVTANRDEVIISKEARGNKDNFIIRTKNMNNANSVNNLDNPVSRALNRNLFKK